jgi:DNA-binding GntR family transcriptional regulator
MDPKNGVFRMEGWVRDRATVANVSSHPGGEGENMPRGRVESKARDEIFRLIVERELAPGTRITEVFLAEKLGISRTPVRIALRELIAEGLLERDSTRGCIIPPLESEDMRHVFSLREKLEGMAAVQAAEHASPEDVESLERILKEGAEDYTGWRREAFARHNEEFHRRIARMSGNAYLEKYIGECFWRSQIYVFFFDTFFLFGAEKGTLEATPYYGTSFTEHGEILAAIRERRCEDAGLAMERHVRASYTLLIKKP